MDLVERAGLDISDWPNYKQGETNPAANPKYCYEWSFIQPGKIVVLNLWYENMKERDGAIVQDFDFRKSALDSQNKGVWRKRALTMDAAIQTALTDNLPIKVIVIDGIRRDRNNPSSSASRVERRLLDSVPWAVTAYDSRSGRCTITRGASTKRYVDQFGLRASGEALPERKDTTGQAFVRNPEVRKTVLGRARGKCELCGAVGFATQDGGVYLETHHVVPLAEEGADTIKNVVALCPNDHREAHHGVKREEIRKRLLDKLTHL